MKKNEDYKRYLFMSVIIIALGVTFTTSLKNSMGTLGIVFIAIGGLLFFLAMKKKQKIENKNN